MKTLAATAVLLLATMVVLGGQTARQGAPAGVIPQGLADGPFVHVMAMHHEEGIRMAGLAAKKAANEQVRAIASRILAGQQKELQELRHFQTTVAEDMAPVDKTAMKRMPIDKLESAAGAAFDRLFLDMMIEHHQDAITMTKSAKLVVANVQEFARRSLQTQAAEIKEMQTLRKSLG